ncbi:MAG: phosphatase PAP2 family protein [Candidatus Aegiribacteria sp.]|nr:phosphatase PAP2 family protein [Candidatus Aegiribacteria sp.]
MLKKHNSSSGAVLLFFLLLIMVSNTAGDDFLRFMGRDLRDLFSSGPLITFASGGAIATGTYFLEDSKGYEGFMGDGFLKDCSKGCDVALGLPLLAGTSVLWAVSAAFGSENTEETGQMLTEGLLITYGITGILKLGAGRVRPDGSNSRSFPSGHSAGTACSAFIIWDRYGPEAGIPAAVVAGFTALSRITLGKHYPSDVIAGAAIGIAAGLAVTKAHSEYPPDDPGLQPVVMVRWSTSNGFGVYF